MSSLRQTTAPETPPPAGQPPRYQPCDSCGALLDEPQRYCLTCGMRRKHAHDPAARFLSAATRRQQRPAAASAGGSKRRSASLATAAAITAVPLALGIGVLVGRSSAGGDGKLIAALKATRAPVIEYSGSGAPASQASTATPTSTAASTLASTLTLSKGYVVELGTLPAGSTQQKASQTEQADRAKGASGVGLIAPGDYTVSPAAPSGDYVIYAAAASSRSSAQAALSKLRKKFPQAKLVSVRSSSALSGGGGQVVNRTKYGAAHNVTGYKPSASSLSQGASVANQDAHSTGTTASGAGLPDVVAVP